MIFYPPLLRQGIASDSEVRHRSIPHNHGSTRIYHNSLRHSFPFHAFNDVVSSVAGEFPKIVQPLLKDSINFSQIYLGIFVNQDVAKSSHPSNPCREVLWNDAVFAELLDHLCIIFDVVFPKGSEDKISHVEDNLDRELKTMLDRPPEVHRLVPSSSNVC